MRHLFILLVLAGTVCGLAAQETKDEPRLALEKQIGEALRDIHNRGAELYNAGDPVGCYRLFQGVLLSYRPLLNHRPEVAKMIENGLIEAEKNPSLPRRAFMLHELIVNLRDTMKSPEKEKVAVAPPMKTPPMTEPKTPMKSVPTVEKLTVLPKVDAPKVVPMPKVEPMPMPKVEPIPMPKVEPMPTKGENSVTVYGTVTMNGQPVAKAAIHVVMLDDKRFRIGSGMSGAAGEFEIPGMESGTYAVLVSAGPGMPAATAKQLPSELELVNTSSIRVKLPASGRVSFPLDLKTK